MGWRHQCLVRLKLRWKQLFLIDLGLTGLTCSSAPLYSVSGGVGGFIGVEAGYAKSSLADLSKFGFVVPLKLGLLLGRSIGFGLVGFRPLG